MTYQRWREEFIFEFAQAFPSAWVGVARKFLRYASTAQRINEIQTSIEVSDREMERLEKQDEANERRARELAESIGDSLYAQGDPRGAPFTLRGPSGRDIPIPGRGLPARAFR